MTRDKTTLRPGPQSCVPVLPALPAARCALLGLASRPSLRPVPLAGKVSHRVAGFLLSSLMLASCSSPDAMSGKEVRVTYGDVTAALRFPSTK